MQIIKIFQFIKEKLFALGLALAVLLPFNPVNTPYATRDSGVFLYMGWRILNGELPYRDVWDHKPPLIFYLNALGQWLGGHSRWGIWVIEVLLAALAFHLVYQLLKKYINPLAATLSAILTAFTLFFVIQGGNFTTEYTLPIQFATIIICLQIAAKPSAGFWRCFWLGVLIALAFFMKQTAIGMGLAVYAWLLVNRLKNRQFKPLLLETGSILAGFLFISLVIVAYFYMMGGLQDFWQAAFAYNFAYSASSLMVRLKLLLAMLITVGKTGLVQLALIGFIISLIWLLKKKQMSPAFKALLAVCVINLPLELLLINVSGRAYPHYNMTLLPVLMILSALPLHLIFAHLAEFELPRIAQPVIIVFISLGIGWLFISDALILIHNFKEVSYREVTDYIQAHSDETDQVLVYGAEAAVNFYAQRTSPTHFIYQYPLSNCHYANDSLIQTYLTEIRLNPPKLLVYTNNPEIPFFEFACAHLPETQTLADEIRASYQYSITLQGWEIYTHQP